MKKNLIQKQSSKIDEQKIIEDKEIMKLKNLSKEIEKLNIKEQYGLEPDKSETDEKDKIYISDLLMRVDIQKKVIMMI